MLRDRVVFGASRMPSVLDQFPPSADSTSGEGRIFSRYFKRYFAVTTPTAWGDVARSSPKSQGRGVADSETLCEKCRWHRHRRCLTRVRQVSHSRRTSLGV